MIVKYVPKHATDLSDVLPLHDPLRLLSNHARRMFNAEKPKIEICEKCGRCGQTEIHHVRPVWTFALDEIVKRNPQTYDDITTMCRLFFFEPFTVVECNKRSNLLGLCHSCHTDADKRAYQLWKTYFEEHYPIVFGERSLQRIRGLMNKE